MRAVIKGLRAWRWASGRVAGGRRERSGVWVGDPERLADLLLYAQRAMPKQLFRETDFHLDGFVKRPNGDYNYHGSARGRPKPSWPERGSSSSRRAGSRAFAAPRAAQGLSI